jgi:hypothetical protein
MRQNGYNDCTRVLTWELGAYKRIFRRLSHKGEGGFAERKSAPAAASGNKAGPLGVRRWPAKARVQMTKDIPRLEALPKTVALDLLYTCSTPTA